MEENIMPILLSGRTRATLSFTATFLLAGSAPAAMVIETDSFTIDATNGGSSSASLAFNPFDASLGTLTGITVQLNGNANSVISFYSNDPAPSTGSGTTTTSLQLTGTGFGPLSMPTPQSVAVTNAVISASSGANPFATTYYSGSPTAVSLSSDVGSASFGAYSGGSMVDLVATFPMVTTIGGSTQVPGPYVGAVGGAAQANGSVSVTYDYAPVPLPSAVWLFVCGLAGVGGLSIKRRAAGA